MRNTGILPESAENQQCTLGYWAAPSPHKSSRVRGRSQNTSGSWTVLYLVPGLWLMTSNNNRQRSGPAFTGAADCDDTALLWLAESFTRCVYTHGWSCSYSPNRTCNRKPRSLRVESTYWSKLDSCVIIWIFNFNSEPEPFRDESKAEQRRILAGCESGKVKRRELN